MGSPVLIDDRDPMVKYLGRWVEGGVAEEFNATTHGVIDDGSQAILNFTGTSVAVYGTLNAPPKPGKTTYTIDGISATIMGQTSDTVLFQHLLYKSPQLEIGNHTLTITATTQGRGFWLDYFTITPTHGASQSASTDAASPTQPPPPMPSMRRVPWTAVIVGSVLGGLLVLLIIAFFAWRGYRRGSVSHSRYAATPLPSETLSTDGPASLPTNGFTHDTRLFHKSPAIDPIRHSGTSLSPVSIGAPPAYVEHTSQAA